MQIQVIERQAMADGTMKTKYQAAGTSITLVSSYAERVNLEDALFELACQKLVLKSKGKFVTAIR